MSLLIKPLLLCSSWDSKKPSGLAQRLMDLLDMPLCRTKIDRFGDGQICVEVTQNVQRHTVFVLEDAMHAGASMSESLVAVYLWVRELKHKGAARVVVMMPYWGYARQDDKDSAAGAQMAAMLEFAGVDHFVCIEVHSQAALGFFQKIPAQSLSTAPVFADFIQASNSPDPMLISPDAGGYTRVRTLMHLLAKRGVEAQIGCMHKERSSCGALQSVHFEGCVQGREVFIIDDVCDTGHTLAQAAQLLHEAGAARIQALITHPVCSAGARERLKNSPLDSVLACNTLPIFDDTLQYACVAPLLRKHIKSLAAMHRL